MPYIQWNDEFSVNVRKIDEQHKILIDKINLLHQAMQDNIGREAQKPVIDALIEYAGAHFDKEESYMREFRFPGLAGHKTEHENFKAKVLELRERLNGSGFVLSIEILNFLKDWLQRHILGTDKQYSRHFNENGLF